MTFLTEDELAGLGIEQSVFHIVGPSKEDHFKLLAAFDAADHADFFLGRIRSIHGGNRYRFLADSPVRAQLGRIDANAAAFQDESEKLAIAFNEEHGGGTAIGAFLLFSLSCPTGRLFALLKFEDERVLSYDFNDSAGDKPAPTFDEIKRTFVQNRNALQKAALIRLDNQKDIVFVTDRQNPARPAAYFERFLHVQRLRTEDELTKAAINVARKVIMKHKDALPPDVVKTLSQRLYDASESGAKVDGEKADDFLQSITGPLPDDSPILKNFQRELHREGMAGESFKLMKGAVQKPRNRRVETKSGVKVIFPSELQNSIIQINEAKGEILIRDQITLNDVELEPNRRTRT
jgi:hypothetical protein